MRAASRLIQRTAAITSSLPAPIGGWNARDSLADMDALDAVQMVNMFPTTSNVVLRGGSSEWATGMSGQVETLMTYNGGNAVEMFAVDSIGLSVYDVTAEGPATVTTVTGLTNARWEYVNITTAGGSFLEAVNGEDDPLLYDGTNWTNPTITGVTASTLSNIELFKNRLWFIQKNTLKAWYLPVQSIQGAAQAFDLSSVARMGGYLVDLATWTIDAGYGVDDMLAFITSQGEVIVYRGTDPSSAATWALVGVWKVGAPIGNRCMTKYGGDLLIITYDGLLPLAAALQSSRLDPRVSLSDKIQGAITTATSLYGGNFGWEVLYYPKNNALILNVPLDTGTQQQYPMNTITKSWCSFSGWAANCWTLTNDLPYFGEDGRVMVAWDDTYADDDVAINGYVVQAFNYLEQRGVQKYFTRARPAIFTDGVPQIFIGLNVDFQLSDTSSPLSFSGTTYGVWDVGLWDSALWGDSLSITNNWQGVTGIGYCAAIVFKTASIGLQIQWASTDLVYQRGWAGI